MITHVEKVHKSIRELLNIDIRVAVVQIRCHPAAYIGGRDFLSEPIVHGKLPLDYLSRNEIPVDHLKSQLRNAYLEWSYYRLYSILEYIASVYKQEQQHRASALLVVFPEYSVPREHLPLIRKWVARHHSLSPAVFAGTHTLPARTADAENFYCNDDLIDLSQPEGEKEKGLCVPIGELNAAYEVDLSTRAVLPVFSIDVGENGTPRPKTQLFIKTILSPFEMTNTAPHRLSSDDLSSKMKARNVDVWPQNNGEIMPAPLSVMPLVCSEALQLSLHGENPERDVFVIPAYSQPDPFEYVVGHLARNQHLVLLSNDGVFGGSRFAIPRAVRGDAWWMDEPNKGILQQGDAVIMADIRFMHLAEVKEVNNPQERLMLRRLSAIVPRNERDDGFKVSQALKQLRLDERERVDISKRRRILQDCLEFLRPGNLHRRKLQRLLAHDHIDERLWKLHGDDVVFPWVEDV